MIKDSLVARRFRVPTALLSGVLVLSGITGPLASARAQDQTRPTAEEQQPAAPAGAQQPGAQPGGPPGQPPQEKPFADLIKDAEVIEGLFNVYRTKDDKFYLEIKPDQFDRKFLFAATMETGLGERGLYAAQMLDDYVFTLHRVGKSVQFLQKNVHYRADDNTPIQRAVSRSFADSVVVS